MFALACGLFIMTWIFYSLMDRFHKPKDNTVKLDSSYFKEEL